MGKKVFIAILLSVIISGAVYVATATLDTAKKATLLFMYQEEKLARDVYITLGQKYPTATTFASIQLSEQTHIDAVESLCIKYDVDISNINESQVGVFIIPELQALYNTLVAQGSVSLLEAQKVGVIIETKDIVDILAAEEGMPSDVVKKFENLRAGSYNHLDAFNKAVAALE